MWEVSTTYANGDETCNDDRIQKTHIKNEPPHFLTWMEDSRPEKLTLGGKFRIESDFQVEHTQILHLDFDK